MAKTVNLRTLTGIACCLGLSLPAQIQEHIWARKSNALLMLGNGHSLVSDPINQEVLLIGGFGTDFAIWDGNGWRHPQQPLRPSRRTELAVAYDVSRQRVVLFGGRELTAGNPRLADTWEWDGSDWVEIPTTISPPAREEHAMAYDPVRGTVLLFGGAGDTGFLADTWEWNGSEWSLLAPASAPPARVGHAMVTETLRNRVLLCGGRGGGGFEEGDGGTWTWDGSTWQDLGFAPDRYDHALAYDPLRDRCLLFGGMGPSAGPGGTVIPMAETWEWDGSSWTEMFPPESPRPMSGQVMAFDHANGRVIMVNENFFADPGPMADMWDYFVPQALPELQPFGTGCGGNAGVLELYPWHAYWPWVGETSYLYVLPQPDPGTGTTFGLIGASKVFDANLGVNLPYDLGVIGMPGCPLLVSTDKVVAIRTGGPYFWALRVPDDMSLLGMRFYMQGYTLDPAANLNGVIVSNGLEAVIGLR